MKDSPDQLRKKLGQWEQKVHQYRGWGDSISGALVNNAEVASVNITIVSNIAGKSKVAVAPITGDPTTLRQFAELMSRFWYNEKESALRKMQEIQRELL